MYNIVMVTLFSLGKGPSLRPRSSHMIRASKWSVGTETMDRNLTIYNHYERFLDPLGEANICMGVELCLCFSVCVDICVYSGVYEFGGGLSFRVGTQPRCAINDCDAALNLP